jgi:putative MFS transporter
MKAFKPQICILFIGALGMTVSTGLLTLVPFAFTMGFAIGGELAVSGTVFKEFIPASYSSRICFLMLGFNLGNLLTSGLAMIFCSSDFPLLAGWRWLCVILLIFEASFILLRLNIPETPFFLASQGRFEEVQAVLNRVSCRQISFSNHGELLRENLPSYVDQSSERIMKMEGRGVVEERAMICQLFESPYLGATLCFGAVRHRQYSLLNNFPICGVLLFMTEILDEVVSTSCVTSYMTSVIQQSACIPAAFIVQHAIDTRLGRKWSVIAFTAASGVFMFAFLLVQDFIGIVVVSSLCVACNNMGWAAFYTLTPETYPTEIRSTGSGWIALNLKVASMASPLATGAMLKYWGIGPAITLFALMMVTAGASGLGMKETKGSKTM